MRYELEHLEAIIRTELKKFKVSEMIEKEVFLKLTNDLKSEAENIKKAFVSESFNSKKEKQVEFYIQYHQEALVQLLDEIIEQINPANTQEIHSPSNDNTILNLYKEAYPILENLLAFIEKHFTKYFNQDAKSPESYRFVVQRELKERVLIIRHELEKKHTDKRLLSIAFTPLDEFIEDVGKKEASYRKLIYLKELLNELSDLSQSAYESDQLNLQVYLSLSYLNFNSNKFYKYCVHKMSYSIETLESTSEKIEKLAYLLKLNNQIQVKPGFALNTNNDTLQHQLSEWLSEELYYHEKRQQLFKKSGSYDIPEGFKFRFDLSVSQIAYFLKLLVDTGVIQNKNTIELIRFMAGIVQTKFTENISAGSLRSKFYQPDSGAIERINDVVIGFFNQIKKDRQR